LLSTTVTQDPTRPKPPSSSQRGLPPGALSFDQFSRLLLGRGPGAVGRAAPVEDEEEEAVDGEEEVLEGDEEVYDGDSDEDGDDEEVEEEGSDEEDAGEEYGDDDSGGDTGPSDVLEDGDEGEAGADLSQRLRSLLRDHRGRGERGSRRGNKIVLCRDCCASCVRTPPCARVYGLPSFATSHSCPAQPSPVGANRPGWVADCAADPLKVATLHSSPSRGLPFFACLGSLYYCGPVHDIIGVQSSCGLAFSLSAVCVRFRDLLLLFLIVLVMICLAGGRETKAQDHLQQEQQEGVVQRLKDTVLRALTSLVRAP
jgi:hypothetical protein